MIQVASCEKALKKQIGNRFKTTRAKPVFLFKRTHLNLSLIDISSTWLAIRECRVGFPVFVGEFGIFEIFMQNDCFAKPDFSYFSDWKRQK